MRIFITCQLIFCQKHKSFTEKKNVSLDGSCVSVETNCSPVMNVKKCFGSYQGSLSKMGKYIGASAVDRIAVRSRRPHPSPPVVEH